MAVDPSGSGDVSGNPYPLDRARDTRGDQFAHHRRSPRLSPAQTGRVEVLGGRDGQDRSTRSGCTGISTTWASPVVDGDGRLYFASAGKSYVIQSGPEFRILAVNDLGDGNHPSPAVAQGRLFLVGMKNIYCIGKGK